MSYPNVPIGQSAWQRQTAQTVNFLLNELQFFQVIVGGKPDSGQSLFFTQFPVALPLAATETYATCRVAPTANAIFQLFIDSVLAGTITFLAGQTVAVVSLTATIIPARTDFEIVAPTPADATLEDITIALAFSH